MKRPHMSKESLRLRVGIILWVASWIPYAIIFGATGYWVPICWTIEIALGIIGIAIAGTVFGKTVKELGWKRAPKAAVQMFLHGAPPPATEPVDAA